MSKQDDSPIEILFESSHLHLLRQGNWDYVRRPKTSGVVAISAITDAREIVLVELYRIPVESRVIELPAGLAGDLAGYETEALAQAARRELLEETGYESVRMDFMTEGPSSAGLSTEVVTFFRARGLRKVAKGGGDELEDIKIHLVPLDDLDMWIKMRQRKGYLVDYKVYATIYFERDLR